MLKITFDIIRDIFAHFGQRNCLRMATALSYQTLLALVPLTVLALSLLTYLDAFYALQDDILFFLFDNFLPTTISHVYDLLQDLILNAKQLTYFGIAGLAVTAILLFASIESSFEEIWRISASRNILKRLIVYIVVIFFGPIALATSMTLFQWLADLTYSASGIRLQGLVEYFEFIIPFGVSFLITFVLYRLVPSGKICWQHSVIGAAFASGLLFIAKQLFHYYLVYFPSYEVIYGALAILPLFLIWLYASWALVLLGATISAVLGFRLQGNMRPRPDPIHVRDMGI